MPTFVVLCHIDSAFAPEWKVKCKIKAYVKFFVVLCQVVVSASRQPEWEINVKWRTCKFVGTFSGSWSLLRAIIRVRNQ
jgi:hypothetical protein